MAKKQKPKTPLKKKTPKPLANPVYNCQNPEIASRCEHAFTAGGVKYYRFIDDTQMPAGRYKYVYAALKEADMRMGLDTLAEFVAIFKTELNGGMNGKQVNMGNLWRATLNIESRLALAFEPASVQRLAAVMYFDITEDLSTYRPAHGAAKIERWNKHLGIDFFLMKPIRELLGLRNISEESLKESIQETMSLIQDLTVDMQTLSKGDSSENGKKVS